MVWYFLMGICRWWITQFFKLTGKNLSDDMWVVCEQFIKFVLVGCLNTGFILVTYYAVVWIFGKEYYLVGQTVGYVVGIINSFFWNSRFVFSNISKTRWKAFVKMCACYGITYVIQIGLLYILVEWLFISEWLVPLLAIIVTTPINFVLNKLFVFRDVA